MTNYIIVIVGFLIFCITAYIGSRTTTIDHGIIKEIWVKQPRDVWIGLWGLVLSTIIVIIGFYV